MRWSSWLPSGLLVVLLAAALGSAQAPPPPACEQQVSEVYQSLVKDQVLTGVPDLAWSQQLGELASAPRQYRTQYEIKRNQADLAEKNVAQLLEQLRQAQAQNAALKAQLPSPPAPSN